MGPARSSIPRSRLPWHRRIRTDPRAVRRWLLVVVLAAATAAATAQGTAEGRRARQRWGATVAVMVTTGSVAAGEELAPRTEVQQWPVAVVPDGAPTHLPDQARAAVDLPAGTVLSPTLLASATGVDLVDRAVVAVGRDVPAPVLDEQDRVDVWDASATRPRLVARGAVVTALRGGAIELAVEHGDLAGVVTAVALGAVVLVSVPAAG